MATTNSMYCVVLPWSFDLEGGVNQAANNLLTEFQAQGSRPLALQLEWNSPKPDDVLPSGVKRCYIRLRSPFEKEHPFRSLLSYVVNAPRDLLTLHRLQRDRRIAAFNVHFPNVWVVNFILLKLLGLSQAKVILSIHGSDIRSAHQERGVMRWLWRVVLRNADAVVACSDGLREEVLMIEPRARGITIYNGIDFRRFTAGANSDFQWPAEFQGKRVVVNVSSFEYRKGHDILLPAFRKVVDRHSSAVLALVGRPGPVSGAVRRSIRELGLDDHVRIFEDVPHQKIYDLLSHADLFVLACGSPKIRPLTTHYAAMRS